MAEESELRVWSALCCWLGGVRAVGVCGFEFCLEGAEGEDGSDHVYF